MNVCLLLFSFSIFAFIFHKLFIGYCLDENNASQKYFISTLVHVFLQVGISVLRLFYKDYLSRNLIHS